LAILLLFTVALPLFGQESGNQERGVLQIEDVRSLIRRSGFADADLSAEEVAQLEAGEPVFIFMDDMDESSLSPTSREGREILEEYEDIDPNFLIESFFILPVEEGTGDRVLEEVRTFLLDITRFIGVPYWSERHEKYFDLFSRIEIKKRRTFDDGSSGLFAEQKMKPFKPHEALYRYWMQGSDFIYTSTNTEPIHYKFVKAVKEGNMFTSLFVHAEPEALVFYGVGGVRAFTFFGVFGDRLQDSFQGRTEAFFKWFHKEFVRPRLR